MISSEGTTRVYRRHEHRSDRLMLEDLVDEADRLIFWRNAGLEAAAKIVSQSGNRGLAALIRRQKDAL